MIYGKYDRKMDDPHHAQLDVHSQKSVKKKRKTLG
jgi:hypothetical protein